MPTPFAAESRSDFMARCVPDVIAEGREQDQAVAMCSAFWEDKAMDEVQETKEQEKPNSTGKAIVASYVPFSATSFADVEEFIAAEETRERVGEVTRQFESIAWNIMHNDEVTDKIGRMKQLVDELDVKLNEAVEMGDKSLWQAIKELFTKAVTKTEDGVSYRASDYAYVPDTQAPSTWKLRMAEGSSGNITKAQLGRAAAAFSPGGFRGQKVQIPANKVAGVKRKLRAAYRKLGVESGDIPESIKVFEGLTIWKEGDLYRWFAVHSNKFRDLDNPPEIIAEEAHQRFVKQVDAGLLPYPELWHWHTKNTKWGTCDWLAYDEGTGMMLSSGYVDTGHEFEAKAIMGMDEPLAVSHGLSVLSRDSEDPTVIDYYITHEISDLPFDHAANKLTGFQIVDKEESVMAIPEEKKAHLRAVGLDENQIDAIDADLEAKAAKAAEAGLDFKDDVTAEPEVKPEVEGEEEPVAETTIEAKEGEVDDLTLPASRQEVLEAIEPIASSIAAINERLEGMAQSDEKKIADKAADTPEFSIAAIVAKQLSAAEAEETQLGVGDMKLAKDKPKETKAEKAVTGIPWIDSMLEKEQ